MNPDELAELIAARRSNIFIDAESVVSDTQIGQLTTAAQWAPNHKRTWPLRIAVVRGDSRRSLGEVVADAMATRGDDEAKVLTTRTKYLRAPIVFVVASAVGETANETEENKYAVAAGIQNMLLMAEAMGLAALWSSPAKSANDAITSFCKMDNTDLVLGLIYVGNTNKEAPTASRPPTRITFLS
jgi:nitroreductase